MDKIRRLCLLFFALLITAQAGASDRDTRFKVELPDSMKSHLLNNMRDHLMALHEIQLALAQDELNKAASVAENRIGMSSLIAHNASHMAPFMPASMRDIGTEMHHAASRFAITVEEGDLTVSLEALSRITQQCVACHRKFKVN